MTALDVPLDQSDAVALLARQTEILEQIVTGAPLPDVLTGIATTLEGLVPDCCCSVLLLDRDAGVLRHGAAPSLPFAYSASIDGMSIGASAGSCGTAAYSGSVVVAADIRADARWTDFRALAERFGLRACWSTPIHGRDGISGTFAVYHRRPHRPTAREEHLVERLTHLASVAIDHDGLLGALAVSEERFRRAFEDNAVGMALATPDGGVTRVNRAMRVLLGRSESELVGTRLDGLFTGRSASTVDDRPDSYEATTRTADGRTLDVAVAVSSIRSAAGTPQALSVNVLDITGRRAAERERSRRVEAELARNAAESANRAKTDFVSALGHELRTPLQAITGFTELLGTMELDDGRRAAALGHISAAAGHILTIVGDVLDVARIEARALPLTLHAFALEPVVAEVLAMVRPLASAERVTLHTAPAVPSVRVHADERRVRQVLLNLVTNAIRYNRADGSVCVGWSVDAGGDAGGVAGAGADGVAGAGADAGADAGAGAGAGRNRVRIVVRDTGAGIPAEHLDRLFTPFDRLGRDSDEGVGLGLPLARGLTEAMGGCLDVFSEPAAGTTVRVLLPAAEPSTAK